MSDTPISVGAGALASAGIAPALGRGTPRQPIGGGLGLAGLAPTATAANAIAPRDSQPLSWTALGANAASSPIGPISWRQARLVAAGTFGSGALVIQGSADGNVWVPLAGISGPNAPGVALPSASAASWGGVVVTPLTGGVVLSATEDFKYPYLRPVVQGGDGSTSINLSGNIGQAAV